MQGYLIFVLGVSSMVVFSLCLFMSCKLSVFWLFLELGTLSLVPCFFLYSSERVLGSLFSYLVVSGMSSSMIVGGLLFNEVFVLVVLGFMVKFGMFPFFGWVYKVVLGSNWLVMWGFSSILKVPFLFLCYFVSFGGSGLLSMFCGSSFVLLSLLFWVYSFGWDSCWCHMMLSSSVSLVAMSVVLSSEYLLYLFLVYVLWSTFVILFFWWVSMGGSSLGSWVLYVFLLLSAPVSLSIFYKLLMGFSMYSCSFFVFLGWVLYSLSEQLFLFCYLLGGSVPRGLFDAGGIF